MKLRATVRVAVTVAVGIFALGLLSPTLALANSCQCFESLQGTQSSFSPLPITGGDPYCAPDTSITDCNPQHFGLETERTVSATGLGSGVLTYVRSCRSYRDNQCQVAVGTSDPSSQFNPCWTKDQCENANPPGDFDSSGKDSPTCQSFNGQPTGRCFVRTPSIKLQVPIPGLGSTVEGGFPGYLAAFYKFFVAMLAVSAVVMVMWGGFKRIMAAGSPEKMKDANDAIVSAITGLILALVSYSLLNLINPKLVNSTHLNIDKVKSQILVNWCPDPDPSDSRIHYQCGDQASIGGQACVGSVCLEGTGGCYKTGSTGNVDANGKSADYSCLFPYQMCQSISSWNKAVEVFGSPKSEYMNECATHSQLGVCVGGGVAGRSCVRDADCGVSGACYGGDCLWGAVDTRSGSCGYYTKQDEEEFCKGNGGSITPKTKCDDFNVAGGFKQYTTGQSWAFCYLNICQRFNDGTYHFNQTCITKPAANDGWSCAVK